MLDQPGLNLKDFIQQGAGAGPEPVGGVGFAVIADSLQGNAQGVFADGFFCFADLWENPLTFASQGLQVAQDGDGLLAQWNDVILPGFHFAGGQAPEARVKVKPKSI